MTNNTINNVPRELLEEVMLAAQRMPVRGPSIRAKLHALLSAPSPAGVDGLEVVAWQLGCQTMGGDVGYVLSWNKSGAGVCSRLNGEEHERALCRLSDAQAIIDGLRGEVEALQSMITDLSKTGIRMRAERDQHAQRIGELEGLLRHAQKQVPTGSGLHMRIDAALSAGKVG